MSTAEQSEDLSEASITEPIHAALRDGRTAAAEALCKAAIDASPLNPSLRVWLGWIMLGRGGYDEALAAAHAASGLQGSDIVSVTRLRTFVGVVGGRRMVVSEALSNLASQDERSARTIAGEAAPAFADYLDQLRSTCAWDDIVDCEIEVPMIFAEAAPDIQHRMASVVSTAHLALGRVDRAIQTFDDTIARRAPRGPAAVAATTSLLVTSLMFDRHETQARAVASWRRCGFDVLSLNPPTEIAGLRSLYPDVSFRSAKHDAREIVGRPLVYLDEMLELIATGHATNAGIINSDIVLTDTATNVMMRERASFVFGHRWDLDDYADEARSSPLLFGYDWFLFDRELAPRLTGSSLVFGAPWWDIWLPIKASLAGATLQNVRDPIALHRNHPTRWKPDDYLKMALVLRRNLLSQETNAMPFSRTQRNVASIARVLAAMSDEQFLEMRNLDWLASLLRGLVQIEGSSARARDDRVLPFWTADGRI